MEFQGAFIRSHPARFEAFFLLRRLKEKRGFAAAGAFGGGVVELQPPVHQVVAPVDLGAVDVEVALLVHEQTQAVGFELKVKARALGVEIKGVGETGATARFDPNPNRHLVREALGAHGPVNFLGCVFREADHVDLSGVR